MTRRDKIGENAYSRYVLEVSWLYVKLGQLDMAQEYLDEVKNLLDHQSVPSSRLYSIYYRVSIELFRVGVVMSHNEDDERRRRHLQELHQVACLHSPGVDDRRGQEHHRPRHPEERSAESGGVFLRRSAHLGNPVDCCAGRLSVALRAAVAGEQGRGAAVERGAGALRTADPERCLFAVEG